MNLAAVDGVIEITGWTDEGPNNRCCRCDARDVDVTAINNRRQFISCERWGSLEMDTTAAKSGMEWWDKGLFQLV